MPMLKWNPQTCGGQYLEDLATAYWYSETLFLALKINLFEELKGEGLSFEVLVKKLNFHPQSFRRYLDLLKNLDLVTEYEGVWSNSQLSEKYLLKDATFYQGNSILWRKNIIEDWNTLEDALREGTRVHFLPESTSEDEMNLRRLEYLKAMDNIARLKVAEILEMFPDFSGKILDVGAGSGAFSIGFLNTFDKAEATLLDIRQVLPQTEALVNEASLKNIKQRIQFYPGNVLEDDWGLTEKYDLIILSNIVHAYAETENINVVNTIQNYLKPTGIVLIHDFFMEHMPIKAHFSDINMFINTYNGKVFKASVICDYLKKAEFKTTPLIPLKTDTGVIFASKDEAALKALNITAEQKIITPILDLGFERALPIDLKDVVVTEFPKNKCRFGCSSSDKKHCSTKDALSPEETISLLKTYKKALLLKGEPPTASFQHKALGAEAIAFKAGFYKAFIFWAGPCSICPHCDPNTPCNNRKHTRPSMEGSGIDVFATVLNAGEDLKTLKEKGEVVKYYALLLLE